MELTSKNVTDTLHASLYQTAPEDPTQAVVAKGVQLNVGFDPERLKAQHDNIKALLDQLPDAYRSKYGHSFLAMCDRKDGQQWTDLHRDMDGLACLAIAAGLGRYNFEVITTGGMPLFIVYVDGVQH